MRASDSYDISVSCMIKAWVRSQFMLNIINFNVSSSDLARYLAWLSPGLFCIYIFVFCIYILSFVLAINLPCSGLNKEKVQM